MWKISPTISLNTKNGAGYNTFSQKQNQWHFSAKKVKLYNTRKKRTFQRQSNSINIHITINMFSLRQDRWRASIACHRRGGSKHQMSLCSCMSVQHVRRAARVSLGQISVHLNNRNADFTSAFSIAVDFQSFQVLKFISAGIPSRTFRHNHESGIQTLSPQGTISPPLLKANVKLQAGLVWRNIKEMWVEVVPKTSLSKTFSIDFQQRRGESTVGKGA